jgi:hypothetical protein
MTPPLPHVSHVNPGPDSVQDSDGDGRLGSKDQVQVPNRRNPAQKKSISVDYFVSVEYKDLAGRSPVERLGETIRRAKAQGFGPKGKFHLDPELLRHTLEHQVHWMKNLANP